MPRKRIGQSPPPRIVGMEQADIVEALLAHHPGENRSVQDIVPPLVP